MGAKVDSTFFFFFFGGGEVDSLFVVCVCVTFLNGAVGGVLFFSFWVPHKMVSVFLLVSL